MGWQIHTGYEQAPNPYEVCETNWPITKLLQGIDQQTRLDVLPAALAKALITPNYNPEDVA